jgi:hypothetical protein
MTAADLIAGTIALRADGTRWFAAFDVEHITDGITDEPAVRIWTATTDQNAGMPRDFVIPAGTPITAA